MHNMRKRNTGRTLLAALVAMLSTSYLTTLTGVDRAAHPVHYAIYFFGIFAVIYFGILYFPLGWKKPNRHPAINPPSFARFRDIIAARGLTTANTSAGFFLVVTLQQ